MNKQHNFLILVFCLAAIGALYAQNNVTIPPCVNCPTGGGSVSGEITCGGFDEIITFGHNRSSIGGAYTGEEETFLSANNKIYSQSMRVPGTNPYGLNSNGTTGGHTQILNGFQDINENWVDYIDADLLFFTGGSTYAYGYYMLVLNDEGDLYFKSKYDENFFNGIIPLTAGALATVAPPTPASDPLIVNEGVLNSLGAPLKFSHILEAEFLYDGSAAGNGLHLAFAYCEDDEKVYSWGGALNGYRLNPASIFLLRDDATTNLSSSTPMPANKINDIIERNGTRFKANDPVLDYKSGFSNNFNISTLLASGSFRIFNTFLTEDGVLNFIKTNSDGNLRVVLPNGEKITTFTGDTDGYFLMTSDAGKVYKTLFPIYDVLAEDQVLNLTAADIYFDPAGKTVKAFEGNYNFTKDFALTLDGELLLRTGNTTFDNWTTTYNIPLIGRILFYKDKFYDIIYAETKDTKQVIYIQDIAVSATGSFSTAKRDLNGNPINRSSQWWLAHQCQTLE